MGIVDFIRARLDEDEQVARAASPGQWHANEESDEVLAEDGITVADGFALSGRQLRATTEHIARHDPARVLAEIDAKRRLLTLAFQNAAVIDGEWGCGHDAEAIEAHMCDPVDEIPELRALALPYSDHPDYREEWRP